MTAKNTALRLLSIKSRTVAELKEKLRIKNFSLEEIDKTVAWCKEYGYLNDEEEGRRRMERLKRKNYGPRFIQAKLKMQGLSSQPIDRSDQIKAIRCLLQKSAWQKKTKPALVAALQRRGFDFECILAVISVHDL
jgi:regulatory protein